MHGINERKRKEENPIREFKIETERYLREIRDEIPARIPIVPKLNHEVSPSCEITPLAGALRNLHSPELRPPRKRDILLEKERSSSREKERCSSRFGRPFFLPLLISKYSKFAGTNGDGVRSGQEGATPSRRKK